jgi:hypothetical protein
MEDMAADGMGGWAAFIGVSYYPGRMLERLAMERGMNGWVMASPRAASG